MFTYGSESITNQAFWMGFSEMFANYNWFLTYLDRLSEVTPADVKRVAREYFPSQIAWSGHMYQLVTGRWRMANKKSLLVSLPASDDVTAKFCRMASPSFAAPTSTVPRWG